MPAAPVLRGHPATLAAGCAGVLEEYRQALEPTGRRWPERAQLHEDPVAIGGVGGSGTRLLAQILAASDVAMASPLNQALDAMEWPPLAKLDGPPWSLVGERRGVVRRVLHIFENLLERRRGYLGKTGRVAWKVPGTYLWLEELATFFPRLQYIHLMRHGLDMAYSPNQRQARSKGPGLGLRMQLEDDGRLTSRSMLDFWLTANENAISAGKALLGDRFLLLRFEDLCGQPRREISKLLEFVGASMDPGTLLQLADSIAAPPTVGRHRKLPWQSDFSSEQMSRLERLGYRP